MKEFLNNIPGDTKANFIARLSGGVYPRPPLAEIIIIFKGMY